jgi:hypothetical protein
LSRFNCLSFNQQYNTGTNIRFDNVAVINPPTVGAAIGFIISAPVPVANITGIRAIIVVVAVIMAGLTRNKVPSITVLRILSIVFGTYS